MKPATTLKRTPSGALLLAKPVRCDKHHRLHFPEVKAGAPVFLIQARTDAKLDRAQDNAARMFYSKSTARRRRREKHWTRKALTLPKA